MPRLGEAGELEDITPGANPANSGDTTVGYTDVEITKSKAAPVRWNGEEQRAVGTTGVYNQVLADQFTDAMRKLVNSVEIDLSLVAMAGASRAYGTAGTAPFGTAGDLSDFAGVAQILDVNGAPMVAKCPVTFEKLVTYKDGIAGTGGSNGNNLEGGLALSGGQLTHDGKNVGSDHAHNDVQPGDGVSGGPV
ncbi:hypothetical protein [Castellaniella ginsengisoli]|uniref:Uncharacterized protein n=1 Tax=Castellaniella ginsengisoli TaxID=546114 RepID=A0AB39D7C9_9BURK